MQYIWRWPTCSLTCISQSAGLVWNKERQVCLNYNQRPSLCVQQRFCFCQFTVGNKPAEENLFGKKKKKTGLAYSSLQCGLQQLKVSYRELFHSHLSLLAVPQCLVWVKRSNAAWHLRLKQNQYTSWACFSLFLHKELTILESRWSLNH